MIVSHVHNNSVEAGLTIRTEDYLYNSAADYVEEKGFLDDVIVVKLRVRFTKYHAKGFARERGASLYFLAPSCCLLRLCKDGCAEVKCLKFKV